MEIKIMEKISRCIKEGKDVAVKERFHEDVELKVGDIAGGSILTY